MCNIVISDIIFAFSEVPCKIFPVSDEEKHHCSMIPPPTSVISRIVLLIKWILKAVDYTALDLEVSKLRGAENKSMPHFSDFYL